MDISISEGNQKRIESKLKSGLYGSADDVVEKALELLDEFDAELAQELADVRVKVQEGIDEIRRGEYTEYDDKGLNELKERIKREGRERRAARQQPAG